MKTTWISIAPLCLVSAISLTACGGGSGGDTNSGGAGGSNTVSLLAEVVQDTYCGTQIPATSAELIVFDDSWRVRSRHKPDGQGKITASIPSTTTVNFSLVRSTGQNSEKVTLIDTFAKHPVGDLGVFKVSGATASGCECVQTDVTLRAETGIINGNAQLTGHTYSTDFMTPPYSVPVVTFENRQICRQPNSAWPVLTAWAGDSYDTKAGQLKEYDPSTSLEIVLDLMPVTESISATADASYLGYFIQTPRGSLTGNRYYPYDSATLFPDMESASSISVRASSTSSYVMDSYTMLAGRSQRKGYTLPLTEALQVSLPDNSAEQELLTTLSEAVLSEKTTYNLSRITDFNVFYTAIILTLNDGSRVDWFFTGPKTGSFPADPLPADYNIDNQIDENGYTYISMGMSSYGKAQPFQQYLSDYVERSRLPIEQQLVGKWGEFNNIFVQIQQ